VLEHSRAICADCDTVLSQVIDCLPEWRMPGGAEERADNSRCGPSNDPLLPHVGSFIHSNGGNGVRGARSREAYIMQKYQMWNSTTHRERALCAVFRTLSIRAANAGISRCILDLSKTLYKRVSENRERRGDNRHALVACSIYMACKMNGVPRSVKEVALMFDVTTPAMTKALKCFQDSLDEGGGVADSGLPDVVVACSKPEDFVARFCSRLGLARDVADSSREVLRCAAEIDVCMAGTPPALAAGAICLCCAGLDRRKVAEVAQLGAGTVYKMQRRMLEHAHLLLLPRG